MSPRPLDISDSMRPCRKCMERKPLICFSGASRPGHRSYCRLCVKEMKYVGRQLKILGEGEDNEMPETTEPLENKNGIFG